MGGYRARRGTFEYEGCQGGEDIARLAKIGNYAGWNYSVWCWRRGMRHVREDLSGRIGPLLTLRDASLLLL